MAVDALAIGAWRVFGDQPVQRATGSLPAAADASGRIADRGPAGKGADLGAVTTLPGESTRLDGTGGLTGTASGTDRIDEVISLPSEPIRLGPPLLRPDPLLLEEKYADLSVLELQAAHEFVLAAYNAEIESEFARMEAAGEALVVPMPIYDGGANPDIQGVPITANRYHERIVRCWQSTDDRTKPVVRRESSVEMSGPVRALAALRLLGVATATLSSPRLASSRTDLVHLHRTSASHH